MKTISNDESLNAREIFFFRQRQKNRIYQSVLEYFVSLVEKRQLTKKEIAQKLGKDPAQITRWFNAPGNWKLDTVSDLLLAMGAEMKHEVVSIETNQLQKNTQTVVDISNISTVVYEADNVTRTSSTESNYLNVIAQN